MKLKIIVKDKKNGQILRNAEDALFLMLSDMHKYAKSINAARDNYNYFLYTGLDENGNEHYEQIDPFG